MTFGLVSIGICRFYHRLSGYIQLIQDKWVYGDSKMMVIFAIAAVASTVAGDES